MSCGYTIGDRLFPLRTMGVIGINPFDDSQFFGGDAMRKMTSLARYWIQHARLARGLPVAR